MTTWFDKVRGCIEWNEADRARAGELRRWLDSDVTTVAEALGDQLAQFNGTQALMTNSRFVRRLHNVLREWVTGALNGSFNREYTEERWLLGQKLVELDLTFVEVVLLGELVRKQLFELAHRCASEHPHTFPEIVQTLEKALGLDLALVYNSYLQARDTEMERVLLSRFLSVTGFSRTLYENLTEVQTSDDVGQQ